MSDISQKMKFFCGGEKNLYIIILIDFRKIVFVDIFLFNLTVLLICLLRPRLGGDKGLSGHVR